MPITFSPATHPADPVKAKGSSSPQQMLAKTSPSAYEQVEEILQTSFGKPDDLLRDIHPQRNGFVQTVLMAYNAHHGLVIRPDDVWLSIITQFSFFVNGNAERLRSMFVTHEGKRELIVVADQSSYTVDFGRMSRYMADLMKEAIVDRTLHDWIIPSFTTTTLTDKTVSSMVMMATMKDYFHYVFVLRCGIPRVTLEGKKQDWEELRRKIERLKTFGVECVAWYHLLAPVLDRFVRAFDNPTGAENIDFWQRVATYFPRGSGATRLTGWIVAFCVFNEKGEWLGRSLRQEIQRHVRETLTASEFWSAHELRAESSSACVSSGTLELDGTTYHLINAKVIPAGFAEVDVTLKAKRTLSCKIVAGLVATGIESQTRSASGAGEELDTVKPVAGWWMFVAKGSKDGDTKQDKDNKQRRKPPSPLSIYMPTHSRTDLPSVVSSKRVPSPDWFSSRSPSPPQSERVPLPRGESFLGRIGADHDRTQQVEQNDENSQHPDAANEDVDNHANSVHLGPSADSSQSSNPPADESVVNEKPGRQSIFRGLIRRICGRSRSPRRDSISSGSGLRSLTTGQQ